MFPNARRHIGHSEGRERDTSGVGGPIARAGDARRAGPDHLADGVVADRREMPRVHTGIDLLAVLTPPLMDVTTQQPAAVVLRSPLGELGGPARNAGVVGKVVELHRLASQHDRVWVIDDASDAAQVKIRGDLVGNLFWPFQQVSWLPGTRICGP